MKPCGVSMTVSERGLRLGVSMPSRVEDAIWEAVEAAIDAGWTPRQFKDEASSAWEERLRDEARHAAEIFAN